MMKRKKDSAIDYLVEKEVLRWMGEEDSYRTLKSLLVPSLRPVFRETLMGVAEALRKAEEPVKRCTLMHATPAVDRARRQGARPEPAREEPRGAADTGHGGMVTVEQNDPDVFHLSYDRELQRLALRGELGTGFEPIQILDRASGSPTAEEDPRRLEEGVRSE